MTTFDASGKMENPRPERQAPRQPVCIRLAFDGAAEITDDAPTGPVVLTIEATNADGDLAEWLTDDFWTETINQYGDRPCSVHFLPTTGAVLHPVILHQVEMLRRVIPAWRTVARGYASDFRTSDDAEEIARSAFSELRVIEGTRPGSTTATGSATQRSVAALFGEIRRTQTERRASTPVLIRVPARGNASSVESATDIVTTPLQEQSRTLQA